MQNEGNECTVLVVDLQKESNTSLVFVCALITKDFVYLESCFSKWCIKQWEAFNRWVLLRGYWVIRSLKVLSMKEINAIPVGAFFVLESD